MKKPFFGNERLSTRLKDYLYPSRWSRKMRIHFSINITIGILIAVLMNVIEHQPVGRTILNLLVDNLIKKESSNDSIDIPKNLVFIEIDSQTDSLWNKNNPTISSVITNRAELSKLLEVVEKSKPKVIVLDIDFSKKDATPGKDDSIISFFQNYRTRVLKKQSTTKMVIPVKVSQDNSIEPSFLDSLFATNPNICIASSIVATEKDDRAIRYVPDFKMTNNNDTIWSIPLVAYALFKKDVQKEKLTKLYFEDSLNKKIENIEKNNNFGLNIYSSRIRYLLKPRAIFPTISANGAPEMSENINGKNKQKADILFYPTEITGFAQAQDIKFINSLLGGKIVVIGNSSPSKGDFHLTPIGVMAGMYVLGNEINTLFDLQINHLGLFWVILIELFIIFFAAYLFLHLHSTLAEFIALFIMGIPLYLLTICIFEKNGTVINIIFPMLGIAVHRVISGFEEMLSTKGKKQHHLPNTNQ